jgi:predicted TPR repeat methyltransferase
MKPDPNVAKHDAYAAEYDEQVRAYGCYLAETLFGLSYEYLQPGQRLLDLGIGSGLAAQLFAKAGLQVCGVDFSPAMLAICQFKGIATELKQHDIGQAPWPYPSGAFDHLVCCGVLHFLPELELIFAEARRVLREGGFFVFTTKSPTALVALQEKYQQETIDGLDIYSHSSGYLERLMKRVGFHPHKVLRCFVGEAIFYAWLTEKGAETAGER